MLAAKKFGGLQVVKAAGRPAQLNMMIYGESGLGKTTLAGSADAVPDMRNVLIIDVEGGTESLRVPYPNVDVIRVASWQDMQNLYSTLQKGGHGYNTVVIDSLTELQKFSMDKIMRELVESKPDRDVDVPSMREWGKNITQIRQVVRAFRDLPVSTIFTALDRADKDERTGITVHKPYLSGKLASEVAAFLDVVVFFYVKEVEEEKDGKKIKVQERKILCQPTASHVAKDRTNKLPMVITDPDMATIWGYISRSLNSETGTETETEK